MQIFLNDIEFENAIATDSLIELLRFVQKEIEKKEETIVSVKIDDMENTIDLSDEESDISLDYIDKLEVFTAHIDNVTVNIISDFKSYFDNVIGQLPYIADRIGGDEKLDGVDNIYQVVDGVKQLNIATSSMFAMGKINAEQKNDFGVTLTEVLNNVNILIVEIVEKLAQEAWGDAKDLLEFDLTLKINELVDFLSVLEKELKGE